MIIIGYFRNNVQFAKHLHLVVCPVDRQYLNVSGSAFYPSIATPEEWDQEGNDLIGGDFSRLTYKGGWLYIYHGKDWDIVKDILGLSNKYPVLASLNPADRLDGGV
ncbi:MAG: hypothetical protein CL678_08595 [Bdellovibrionaceae bacterium]|nr:hypothetical protein [Pseudobdellovibrionaceae bacterium]